MNSVHICTQLFPFLASKCLKNKLNLYQPCKKEVKQKVNGKCMKREKLDIKGIFSKSRQELILCFTWQITAHLTEVLLFMAKPEDM